MSYADAFKSLRHAYRLTQVEFARLLQVSRPTIQKLEAGNYPPSEKIAAGLVELFRSDRFRGEFRARVESGDLHSVKTAFGDLLGLVDVGKGGASPAASVLSGSNVCAELLSMMQSQQDKLLNLSTNLSESNKNLSESNKSLAESGKNWSESHKNLSESIKILAKTSVSKSRSL